MRRENFAGIVIGIFAIASFVAIVVLASIGAAAMWGAISW